MAKLSTFVISCSADGRVDTRKLFIWGQIGNLNWLPETQSEAKKRIIMCQKQNNCSVCDCEIHQVMLERTKKTYLQLSRCPNGEI